MVATIAGLNGKSPNFYMYVINSPLNMKDPTGRIPLPLITAVLSTGAYLITTPRSEISWGGKMLV